MTQDYITGTLVGEIIWLRYLSKYTETSLIATLPIEEQIEYKRLNDRWFKQKEQEKIDNFWHKYRDYANSLTKKYFPEKVEYVSGILYTITNLEEFFNGVKSYLWNTDECCYTFTRENIIIEDLEILGCYIHIDFKLNV